MNPFVASPDWHWWIIFYFFLDINNFSRTFSGFIN